MLCFDNHLPACGRSANDRPFSSFPNAQTLEATSVCGRLPRGVAGRRFRGP